MGINFPPSPTVGTKYPTPSVPGVPTYTWDGEKWTTIGGAIATDILRAPFDAMAYGGLQINGGMEVSQSRGATGGLDTGGYIVDGWKQFQAGTMVTAVSQYTGPVGGFPYFLGVTVTTAQASLGGSDFSVISQPIEGWRIARLQWGTANAQPITIGFWSTHHRTGVYTGTIRSSISNRTYGFAYTHNVADIAQYNVITIPGDTAGTWASDNRIGFEVIFAMAAGSAASTPSINAWVTGNYIAAPGQINAVAATTDAFRITGVIVLPGTEAPSAARSPFVMRSYDQELLLCKRYYWRLVYVTNQFCTTLQAVSGTSCNGPWLTFPVTMRAAPTAAMSPSTANFTIQPAAGGGASITGLTVPTTQDSLYIASIVTTGGLVAGNAAQLVSVGNTAVILDARL